MIYASAPAPVRMVAASDVRRLPRAALSYAIVADGEPAHLDGSQHPLRCRTAFLTARLLLITYFICSKLNV